MVVFDFACIIIIPLLYVFGSMVFISPGEYQITYSFKKLLFLLLYMFSATIITAVGLVLIVLARDAFLLAIGTIFLVLLLRTVRTSQLFGN